MTVLHWAVVTDTTLAKTSIDTYNKGIRLKEKTIYLRVSK